MPSAVELRCVWDSIPAVVLRINKVEGNGLSATSTTRQVWLSLQYRCTEHEHSMNLSVHVQGSVTSSRRISDVNQGKQYRVDLLVKYA